jgi:hypothetical protein
MAQLLADMTLEESGRILPQKNGVSVRPYPFPYRAALTVNNDADSMSHKVFEDWHAYVCGTKSTAYGDGLGLEIGDSFWLWSSAADSLALHEQHAKQQPWKETSSLARLVELGRSGWLDTLHGIGSWSDDYAPPREIVAYGLDRLEQLGIRPTVWVNHGATPSNIAGGPWAEGWYQKADWPGHPCYSMDLLRKFGFRYHWTDACFELEKFGDHLDYGSQPRLALAVARYDWHWINRYKNLDLKNPATRQRFANLFNKTIIPIEAKDDGPMYLFKRFRGTDVPSSSTFAGQVTADRLDDLEAKRGCVIIYQHFGVFSLIGRGKRPGGRRQATTPVFDAHAIACWLDIADRHRQGKLFVATSRRLLDYVWLREHLAMDLEKQSDRWIVTLHHVDCPVSGRHELSQQLLNGLSLLVPEEAPEFGVEIAGRTAPVFKRAADPVYPGFHALYLDWSALEWPEAGMPRTAIHIPPVPEPTT